MDIRELQLFLKLAETLHYTKTSGIMAISPSALSRTIQRMEEQVGKRLFFRDNRGVMLSPAGERFRNYALRVMDEWETLQDDLSEEGRDVKGEILIYSSVTGCYSILPDLLECCRKEYPGIQVNLKTGSDADALFMVQNGLADISVAAEPDSLPEGLSFVKVTSTPLELIAPASDCRVSRELNSRHWMELPLVLPEKGLARKRLDSFFRARKVVPDIYSEVNGNEAIIAMVSLGLGLGLVPALVHENSIFRDKIRVLFGKINLKPYHVGLCVNRRKSHSPLIAPFLSLVGCAGVS